MRRGIAFPDCPQVDASFPRDQRSSLRPIRFLAALSCLSWLAARDMIEWLQAEYQRPAGVGGLGRDGHKWAPGASAPAAASAVCPRCPVGEPALHGAWRPPKSPERAPSSPFSGNKVETGATLGARSSSNYSILLVGRGRLERPTNGLKVQCPIYASVFIDVYATILTC